jgi:hypothetical protein
MKIKICLFLQKRIVRFLLIMPLIFIWSILLLIFSFYKFDIDHIFAVIYLIISVLICINTLILILFDNFYEDIINKERDYNLKSLNDNLILLNDSLK